MGITCTVPTTQSCNYVKYLTYATVNAALPLKKLMLHVRYVLIGIIIVHISRSEAFFMAHYFVRTFDHNSQHFRWFLVVEVEIEQRYKNVKRCTMFILLNEFFQNYNLLHNYAFFQSLLLLVIYFLKMKHVKRIIVNVKLHCIYIILYFGSWYI